MEGLKWYTDTKKWRREHILYLEDMDQYDNIWIDRLMYLSIAAVCVGIMIGRLFSM